MKQILFVIFALFAIQTASAQVMRNRTLIWEDPDNPAGSVTKYTIYYGTTAGGPYTLGKIDIPAGTLTGQVTLAKGTYYFVVTASNPDAESPYSNEATTTIYDNARKVINFRIIVTS